MGDYAYQQRVLDTQLGMSYGTAANQLRKLIMFQLVQQTGRDRCYKCQELISTAEELSIEHKEPWRGQDIALFWDLDNIAFSHRRCNRPHKHGGPGPGHSGGGQNKVISPPDMAWCARCKQYREIKHFYKQRRRWNGLKNNCKDCEYLRAGLHYE